MGTPDRTTDDEPTTVPGPLTENLLLSAMAERERLTPAIERLELTVGQEIYEAGAAITHYYFPVRGVISLVKEMPLGTVEVGTVGPEGLLGIPALLGVGSTSSRAIAQSPVLTDRIFVDDLDAIFEVSPAARQLLLRYVLAFHEEVAQSVVCNRLHSLEERCARWLLMTQDRIGMDTMELKQRFLSFMLGVHRPAVSLAMGALQRAGFVRYSRGKIQVTNRAGLEEASCECYAIGRDAYTRARLPLPTAGQS